MSHFNHVILMVIQPTKMEMAFNTLNDAMVENNFEFDEEPFNKIWLEDIDTNDGKDYLFEAKQLNPKSKEERNEAIRQLKTHRTGGTINYRGIKNKFVGSEPYDVQVAFCSLDNQTIEYIVISARDYIYDPHKTSFKKLIATIEKTGDIVGIVKGLDYPDEWSEEEVAENIRDGKWDKIPKRILLKRKNLLQNES